MKVIQVLLFTVITLFGLPGKSVAQNAPAPWTLQKCIDYALKNNIQIRQSEITRETYAATLVQDKASLLPSLNANASHSYNFGRTIDPFTNQFANSMVLSQNFSLSSSLVLFNGLQKVNTVQQGEYDLKSSQEDLDKMKNDISLNIASGYLQILFNQELLVVAANQVGISQQQVERTKRLVEAGTMARGNLLQLQAQLATDELSQTNAQNQLDLSYLSLAQLLDLDSVGTFTIVKPDLAMPSESLLMSATQIYNTAVTVQPAIRSAQYKLRSYDMALKIAKGAISPRLSVNAAIGTGFSGASKELVGIPVITGFVPNGSVTSTGETVLQPLYSAQTQVTPFSNQVNDNFNRNIGFYLTIPLFNGLQTHGNIQKAKLAMKNADLNLQYQEIQLRKTIQQAYADANAAFIKYTATKKAVDANQEAFKYVDQKFNVGMVNSLDYNDAKNKLIKAQSDLLQAKYDYIFKLKILDFYQGKPLVL